MSGNIFCAEQGIRISDLRGVHCAYEVLKNESGWIFTVVLDAPRIPAFLQDYCCLLPEPGYFTLELPVEGEDAYDIYYVDGCTRPVLQAIVSRYGNLLSEDGDVRFGFSSHESEEQVYVGDLKTVQVYTASPQTVQKLLEKYEIPEEPGCLKLWDILSDENPCELIHVEVEEENIFDLPELLSEAGIYFSGRRED